MAVLSTTALTLADHAKRIDPDGKIAKIVEILNDQNEILSDMKVVEGNLPTGHRTTIRTGLPSATWRMLNYGVPKGKSTTAQVTDSCGMLETYSEVDKALVDLSGDPSAFRLSEAVAFMEGMNQQMASTLFYGNQSVNPERFTGLAPRYNTLSTNEDLVGFNVIDAGGTGSDNTSIWLVVWGDNTIHGILPKGSTAGLQHRDLGEQTLQDGAGGQYQGYREHYKWDLGLTVRDWRYAVRIANIDVSALTDPGTVVASTKALVEAMISAEEKIPNFGMGTPVWYANRSVRTALRRGMLEKIANNLTNETLAGKQVTMFNGTTLRRTDAILNTESRVV